MFGSMVNGASAGSLVVSATRDDREKKAFTRADVDVDLGNKLKRGIQSLVR
jgi:hypothetical protein